ncbi:MAG: hypothetical protein Q8N44_05440 [Rubrivivax sp.]|nr:hypothetical protein [Rubrivivax sp.]MDP3083119.1 hypothetical protein [Rubrivivax sp.]
MDLLRTAVVDITSVVATCHALKSTPGQGDPALQRKLRTRLRREVKRGTLAYIDALARTRRGVVDDALLATCRLAAEQQMAHAIVNQGLLSRIMASEAGSLDGLAAARHDLWRLAHMAIYLRAGMATLRESGAAVDARSAGSLAGRLRRRLRKALIAYARATLRTKKPRGRLIAAAREAALAKIGKRGAAQAERLSAIEAGGDPKHTVIRLGVTKPLLDLALDWKRHESDAT